MKAPPPLLKIFKRNNITVLINYKRASPPPMKILNFEGKRTINITVLINYKRSPTSVLKNLDFSSQKQQYYLSENYERPPTSLLKLKEKEKYHRLINYAGNISKKLL